MKPTETGPSQYRSIVSPDARRRRYEPAARKQMMSASHTNATNTTRADNRTDGPTISAIITEAGRPKSELRRNARFT
jgi:hypothetical protein